MTALAHLRKEMSEERSKKTAEDFVYVERLSTLTPIPIRNIGSCIFSAGFDL